MAKRHKSLIARIVKQRFPAPTPPARVAPPLTPPWHPTRAGAPQAKVYHVKHDRDGRRVGRYATLVKNASDYYLPITPLPAPPMPDVVIQAGWLYATGNSPCVGTKAVVAHSEGCALALYHFTEDSKPYSRVCFLEGDCDQVVWIHPWKPLGVDPPGAFLVAGTYIDVESDPAHDDHFKDWRGGTATVGFLDQLNTPAGAPLGLHEQVMDDIDATRDSEDVS